MKWKCETNDGASRKRRMVNEKAADGECESGRWRFEGRCTMKRRTPSNKAKGTKQQNNEHQAIRRRPLEETVVAGGFLD